MRLQACLLIFGNLFFEDQVYSPYSHQFFLILCAVDKMALVEERKAMIGIPVSTVIGPSVNPLGFVSSSNEN